MKKYGVILATCMAMSMSSWSQQTIQSNNSGQKNNATAIITINVQDADMVSVLKLLAAQADCSVVVGPDVAATKLNVELRQVPLDNALDAILKPHGYGYRQMGNTIVVDKLESLQAVTMVEPLISKVFQLKYIDATDALSAVTGMLSERGKCSVLHVSQTLGWEFTGGSSADSAAKKAARMASDKNKSPSASKTLIVQDVPSAISQIGNILDQIDVKSSQVDIRAFFVEVSGNALKDIGMDWRMNIRGDGFSTGELLTPAGITPAVVGTTVGNLPMNFPGASETSVSGTQPYNSGLNFGLARAGDRVDLDVWLHAVEQNGDINVLSAPRITTQDNQEAAIVVGTRLPILTTTKETDSGGNIIYTTDLDYYEQIGIQLNVAPKICDNGMINLILHPVVSEQTGDVTGPDGLSSYPIIQTREAETRLTVEDGQVCAIGGLINDRRTDSEQKVPILGDIPLIGRLFRRDTQSSKKVELVILLSASVIDDFEPESQYFNQRVEESKDQLITKWENMDAPAVEIDPVEDPVIAPVAVESADMTPMDYPETDEVQPAMINDLFSSAGMSVAPVVDTTPTEIPLPLSNVVTSTSDAAMESAPATEDAAPVVSNTSSTDEDIFKSLTE